MPVYLKWRLIQLLFKLIIPIQRSRWFSPATQPDRKLRPSQSYLYPSRVFLPTTSSDLLPPLVIDVHGGAFIVNTPNIDDLLCRYLADNAGAVVISIDYRKAPQHPFPAAYEDIVEQISVLVNNPPSPVDTSKIILIGSSAGGNLVLAACQDERLRGRLAGVIGLYPVTDATLSKEEKMSTRPDPSIPDLLESTLNEVMDMYLGKDKAQQQIVAKDQRVSPGLFEHRKDLPEHVFLMGAEHDVLCNEAKVMAERLAGNDERMSAVEEGTDGWQAGTVQWYRATGQTHGYDLFGPQGETKEKKAKRLLAREALWSSIAEWIQTIAQKQ